MKEIILTPTVHFEEFRTNEHGELVIRLTETQHDTLRQTVEPTETFDHSGREPEDTGEAGDILNDILGSDICQE